jgi:hypothetical protein
MGVSAIRSYEFAEGVSESANSEAATRDTSSPPTSEIAYQRAHVFIIGRRSMQMDRSHLRPIEDVICQSMLHIAKARRFARALELRVVDDKLGLRFACGHSKDGCSLKQSISHRVGKVSALYTFERGADRVAIQQIALHNFGPELPESIGPCIQLVDEGTNRNTLFEQKGCYSFLWSPGIRQLHL